MIGIADTRNDTPLDLAKSALGIFKEDFENSGGQDVSKADIEELEAVVQLLDHALAEEAVRHSIQEAEKDTVHEKVSYVNEAKAKELINNVMKASLSLVLADVCPNGLTWCACARGTEQYACTMPPPSRTRAHPHHPYMVFAVHIYILVFSTYRCIPQLLSSSIRNGVIQNAPMHTCAAIRRGQGRPAERAGRCHCYVVDRQGL